MYTEKPLPTLLEIANILGTLKKSLSYNIIGNDYRKDFILKQSYGILLIGPHAIHHQ